MFPRVQHLCSVHCCESNATAWIDFKWAKSFETRFMPIKTNESNSRFVWSEFFFLFCFVCLLVCLFIRSFYHYFFVVSSTRLKSIWHEIERLILCTQHTALDIISSTFHKIHLFMCKNHRMQWVLNNSRQFRLAVLLYLPLNFCVALEYIRLKSIHRLKHTHTNKLWTKFF